jgi:hypothetical protein
MDSPQPAAFRLPVWKLALLVGSLGVATLFTLGRAGLHSADAPPAAPAEPPARPSLYTKTEPARNPEKLTVLVDPQKVVGWISGSSDHAGDKVTIKAAGKVETVKVGAGNTFTWPYKVSKNTRAELQVGKLRQTVQLAAPEKFQPSVFFVVDRDVYRPGQTLHFAAFLRQLDERGEFVPLARKPVEVQLKTDRKGTVVNRWKVTSDETGRLTGSYKFADADALDGYSLSVAGYQGTAGVSLLEYRKAKVQLAITGERAGPKVKLRFQALDFMDKPVPASKVTFTAEVMRNQKPAGGSLKGEDFAYPGSQRLLNLRMEDLGEDEQLLVQVDPTYDPGATLFDSRQAVAVAATSGEVKLDGKPAGEFTLDIPKACQQPGTAVVVNAILTDASGREVRQKQTIPLQFLSDDLKLSLPRTTFEINEPIAVKARGADGQELKGSATLIAMKLSAAPPVSPFFVPGWQFGGFQALGGQAFNGGFQGGALGLGGIGGFQGGFNGLGGGFGGNLGMMGFGGPCFIGTPCFGFNCIGFPMQMQPGRWQTVEPPEAVKRTLATATVFKGDTATLRLSEPGAYKLVAIVERPDGSKGQQEIGCLVQPRNQRQPLTLLLDRPTWATGDTLTGMIQSRYAGARVLMTLRDSVGIRLWKTVELDKKGVAEIKEVLPDDLRYGCMVTVQYADDPAAPAMHLSSRAIHVEPVARTLKIETKTKPVYGPGEKVVLDIQVNRNEPVDLIVSVYDQALANIRPQERAGIRSFYLADERAFNSQGLHQLQRLLAGVTLDSLLRKAKKLVKEQGEPGDVFRTFWVTNLLTNAEQKQLNIQDVVTLLNLAGVKARLSQYTWGLGVQTVQMRGRSQLLLELLGAEHPGDVQPGEGAPDTGKWKFHISVLNDTFIVSDYNPAQPGVIALPRLGFMGGFPGGFGGMAGFGGGLGALGFGGGFQGSPSVLLGQGALGALGGIGLNGAPSVLPQQPGLIGADADQKNLVIRRDFSDSAYWNAKVRTDDKGKARVEFQVPDSLTGWQAIVTGVSAKMHVGQGTATFQVSRPVMIGPILPRLFTEGDVVKVSANVVNRSKEKQKLRVRLKVDNGQVLDRPEAELALDAGQSDFVFWTFKAGSAGFTQLLMSAECPAGSDASLKRLPVARAAVEEVRTYSGFCKEPVVVKLPEGVDPESASLEIRFAPTLAADLVDTLDYLVDYPYGCVEQTMSRFLPAIKVAQILKKCQLEHKRLEQKLPGCVQGGIKRLLELQQPDGGWGWNGNSQTHEMMTPYALYGLLQAEKAGYAIGNENAITNGLNRVKQFIDNMKADKQQRHAADRMFCLYVYCHRHEMTKEWWDWIDQLADENKLSDYALALALDLAVQKDRKDLADTLAGQLHARAQGKAGLVHWKTAGFSRWGDDPLEITAVALKALVAHDPNDKLIPGVLAYFSATKHGNRWNSTKDTALIVFALCDYLSQHNLDLRAKAQAFVRCNDGPLTGVTFEGPALMSRVVVPGKQLHKGENKIAFADSTAGVMYRMVLRVVRPGQDLEPQSSGITVTREYWLLDGKGKRARKLTMGDTVPRGSYLESVVRGSNEAVPQLTYVLVENPRPSGCEFLPEDDARFVQTSTPYVLREEREPLLAFHHEQAPAQLEDRCVLHAELAGEFVVAPARVELMYQTEVRGHSGTFRFKVVDPETPRKP